MMRVYWYAPFNNAGELATAAELATSKDVTLTVQALAERFGKALPLNEGGDFELVRDLPAPSGEGARERSKLDRARVAIERAARRHRLVRSGRFDVVHLHTFNPITDWLAIPLLRRHCRVVIQSVHNVRPHDAVMPRPLESVALRLGYRACSVIFVAHPVLREMLVKDIGVPSDRIRVVPFALTMPITPTRSYERDEDSPVRFLFFGTLRNNKGIKVLVDAIDNLERRPRSQGTPFSVHIAGRGEDDLEALVLQVAANSPNVTAEIGFISNARRDVLYRDADCVLLPYTELQAQSGVLHDAYASRLPVIASDVRALGAAVRNDGTGWVVPPSDPTALGVAMLEVSGSADERRRRGDRAGVRAEASTAKAVAAQLIELYPTLVKDETG